MDSDIEITTLLPKKTRPTYLLGQRLDQQVQAYLKRIREQRGIVTASVAVAAAKGMIIATNSLAGIIIQLNRHWAYGLLDRMKFVRRKATTSKTKTMPSEFARIKAQFLDEIVSVVMMEEIPPELILNRNPLGSSSFLDNGRTWM